MNDPSPVSVYLGQPVEIEPQERAELWRFAKIMLSESDSLNPGWFEPYCRAHLGAHRILCKIFARSQSRAERLP